MSVGRAATTLSMTAMILLCIGLCLSGSRAEAPPPGLTPPGRGADGGAVPPQPVEADPRVKEALFACSAINPTGALAVARTVAPADCQRIADACKKYGLPLPPDVCSRESLESLESVLARSRRDVRRKLERLKEARLNLISPPDEEKRPFKCLAPRSMCLSPPELVAPPKTP